MDEPQIDLPLTLDASGPEVVDLHARLSMVGYQVKTLQPNLFGPETSDAVLVFQRGRGLDETGVVDAETWASLVDACHHFGERLLCRRTPMMRGDDVAELQLMLGSLGFDAGWIDGVFGADTEEAVADFQRNAGLPVDGVADPATITTLTRLRLSANAARPVAAVREQEALRHGSGGLVGRRVVVGDLDRAPSVAGAIGAALRREGARVLLLHHPDGETHAKAANQFDAEMYVGVMLTDGDSCDAAFYETDAFSSYGGRHLATLIVDALSPVLGSAGAALGKRLSVLRRTRMPAVLLQLSADCVTDNADEIAGAVLSATEAWVAAPEPV